MSGSADTDVAAAVQALCDAHLAACAAGDGAACAAIFTAEIAALHAGTGGWRIHRMALLPDG